MIILVSGKKGSGKSTLTSALRDFWGNRGTACWKYSLAEPLSEMAKAVYLVGGHYGITPPEGGKDSDLMQALGDTWGNQKDPLIWVNAAKHRMSMITDRWEELGFFYIALLERVCHPVQFDAWPDALTIRLECDRDIRKARAVHWPADEHHASETALDAYAAEGRFDLVLDSGKHTVDELVQVVNVHVKETLDSAFSKKPRKLQREVERGGDQRA